LRHRQQIDSDNLYSGFNNPAADQAASLLSVCPRISAKPLMAFLKISSSNLLIFFIPNNLKYLLPLAILYGIQCV
jgi:hypothetical protein